MAAKKVTETAEATAEVKMIKAKVIKAFYDKETGKIHRIGETLEITEERYKEILSVGKFVKKA